jgi:hypothetical protein
VNDTALFSIVATVPAYVMASLDIDPETGMLSVSDYDPSVFNYEVLNTTYVTVRMFDSGGNSGSGPVYNDTVLVVR